MKKCKLFLLLGILIFVMTACPVKVKPEPPEKVEQGLTEEMKRRDYELTFDIDGKSHLYNDSQLRLDFFITKGSTYMQDWWTRTMQDYKGPIVRPGYSRGVRRFIIGDLGNGLDDRVCGFLLDYDNNKNCWLIHLDFFKNKKPEKSYRSYVDDKQLNIYILNEDIYITITGKSSLVDMTGKVQSELKLSNLFFKGKLINGKEGERNVMPQVAQDVQWNALSCEGVSRVQDLSLSFIEIPKFTSSSVKSFFRSNDAIKMQIKMDSSIDYLYQNGDKVFGSWNAEGTVFSYKPGTPYQANNRVELIISDEIRDAAGNRLYMPFHFSFKTGDSELGMPNASSPFNGEHFNSIDLRWRQADSYAVAEHSVERSDSPSGSFVTIKDSLIPGDYALEYGNFAYQDSTVVAGKSYYYRVIAKGKNGVTVVSKVVEGHALDIVPAQLGREVVATYYFDQTRAVCYKYAVVKGKRYRFEIKDKTNSTTFTAEATAEIRYKAADGTFTYLWSPNGSSWDKRTETITAPADEILFVIKNHNYIGTSNESNNLSFILTEVSPAGQ